MSQTSLASGTSWQTIGSLSRVERLETFPPWLDYGVVFLAAVTVASAVWLVLRSRQPEGVSAWEHVAPPRIALGFTGLAVGMRVGNSLTPLASAALSGFLTVAGALLVFVVSREVLPRSARVSGAVALSSVALAVIYGASIGAAYRVPHAAREAVREMARAQQQQRYEADLRLYELSQKLRMELEVDTLKKGRPGAAGGK